MAWLGPSYRTSGELQLVMAELAKSEGGTKAERAACARAWVELDRHKRVIRGISDPPRLTAKVDVSSVRKLKRLRLEAPGPVLDAEQVTPAPEPVLEPLRQDETSSESQDSSPS